MRDYRNRNRDAVKASDRRRYQENPEKHAAKMREWRRKNRDRINLKYGSQYWKKYYAEHRSERLASAREYHKRHKEKRVARVAAYVAKNREKIRAYRREYFRVRRLNDPIFVLRIRLKDRLNKALRRKGTPRACRTMDMVGCTIQFLKEHIEKQFTAGMTWELFVQGKIHLDHIKPFAAFDLSDAEQQKAAMHWSNLKPEWPRPNLQKHSHWNGRSWRHKDHVTS